MAFKLGIDTGGTYTDAAIVDANSQAVLATAKSLTSHGDLSVGIAASLRKVLAQSGDDVEVSKIELVSVSTTLATNALVEGKGSQIGVILIGFSDDMLARTELGNALPDAEVVRVAGGHRHDGSEQTALDEVALQSALQGMAGTVDAFAIASVYSVRNSQHETRAAELVAELLDCPTTLSSELSDALNGPRRALTAAFNARIIALIVRLVGAVRAAMQSSGINAPLMIVKGDGSIASADAIIARPIETILSGPAASVIGAGVLSGLSDFVISDIGGTTTDLALVRAGWPRLNASGARIGPHQTMVRAIDMRTLGLGGDSAVDIDSRNRIVLNSQRVVPMSLLGQRWPEIKTRLRHALDAGMGLAAASQFLLRPEGTDENLPDDLKPAERELLNQLADAPKPWRELVRSVSDRHRARRLLERGLLQVSGLTPSDAAHVLDLQSNWDREAAELACLMMGRSHGLVSLDDAERDQSVRAFAEKIMHLMWHRSTEVVMQCLGGKDFKADDTLAQAVSSGATQLGELTLSVQPSVPLVAVGGPAPVFYPGVAQRLSTKAVVPEHSSVANAIGAALGMIKVDCAVEITVDTKAGYWVHCDAEPLYFKNQNSALREAENMARDLAERRASASGGIPVDTVCETKRIDIPNMSPDRSLVSATVLAQCLSRPGGLGIGL